VREISRLNSAALGVWNADLLMNSMEPDRLAAHDCGNFWPCVTDDRVAQTVNLELLDFG
jgi:hypothetical protein